MKSKLLTASFIGNYLIVSSVAILLLTNWNEAKNDESGSFLLLLVPILLGIAIKRKKSYARIIVAFSSSLLFVMACLILILGFVYGTEHVNYGLGSFLQVSYPTILQHILLGSSFALWFGLPAFFLASKPVRQEFENETSRIG